MKTIVAGSRTFNDYELLKDTLQHLNITEVVSGTARGADRLGEKYATENNILLSKFPADWEKYGKGAGYVRNEEMAKYADLCIVFWDGQSKGSLNMINLALKYKIHLIVINF